LSFMLSANLFNKLPLRRCFLLLLLTLWSSAGWAEDGLRLFLEGLRAGAPLDLAGQRLQSPNAVMAFYLDNNHSPVWVGGGSLSLQNQALQQAIAESALHGFNPARYHLDVLSSTSKANQPDFVIELLATDAFLTQARHRAFGAVSPKSLDPDWHLIPVTRDFVADLQVIVSAGEGVQEFLQGLWPKHDEYWALVTEKKRILELEETQSSPVTQGPLLKKGVVGARVRELKHRLLGPNDHDDVFDDVLDQAVRVFQDSAGLETDGLVGAGTLEALNATRVDWLDRLNANLERWRWLPSQMPESFVSVNIAAFELRAVSEGEEAFKMRVVVGRPFRETPVFTQKMRYMVLNPFWNVPFKLATEDKLPMLKTNPSALHELGYQARRAGEDGFVDVTSVDWSGVNRRNFNFLLRQLPGPKNALGHIKFMLPNEFSIYLHDTNDRTLFLKRERSFSSGCIRLSEPEQLASWLLHKENRLEDAAKLSTQIASGDTVTVNLKTPMPVYIAYFTAFTTESSQVVYRRDIYQRDRKIVEALAKENVDQAA
jgi:murein L,D-transpeptidase YcbB/YkuD